MAVRIRPAAISKTWSTRVYTWLTPPATNHTLTIPLEYREVSFTPMSVSLAANMQTGAFKKEPQLGKSKPNIRRGRLNPPNGDTNLIDQRRP